MAGGTGNFLGSYGKDIIQAVVGAGGIVAGSVAASRQAGYLNELTGMDRERSARAQGLSEYFLGGGKASGLEAPGFQSQFAEIDFAVQEQQRQIDTQSRKSRQAILDNMPPGGAKLRALAELSVKTQDLRGKTIREAQTRKRDLDIRLTNEYTKGAMTQGFGPSYDARLWASQKALTGRETNLGAISGALGSMTERAFGDRQAPGVGVVPARGVPGSAETLKKKPFEGPFFEGGF